LKIKTSQSLLGFFFLSAATYANAILAASTHILSQAPLTSFITRSLIALYPANGLSDQIQSKLQSQIHNKHLRYTELRAMAPKSVLMKYSVLKKYPSRTSKLRVHYSHNQQPCIQALAFTMQLFVLCITSFSCKEEKESQLCI